MGLTLSSSYQNQDFFKPKSTFRKAGEAFKAQDYRTNSSKARGMIDGLYNYQESKESADEADYSQESRVDALSAPSAAAASQPSGKGEIDFAGWAADTASKKPNSTQTAADWEKIYRKNYAEDQARKAKFDSYTGIKTQEEFNAAEQANHDKNSGNIDAYTAQMHADHAEFSTYAKLKSDQGHFNKYADKWRKK
tara:strand:+ start:705 stop:1286 length:582 start_codon:yes stop_codon:yes gene_type:complete